MRSPKDNQAHLRTPWILDIPFWILDIVLGLQSEKL